MSVEVVCSKSMVYCVKQAHNQGMSYKRWSKALGWVHKNATCNILHVTSYILALVLLAKERAACNKLDVITAVQLISDCYSVSGGLATQL